MAGWTDRFARARTDDTGDWSDVTGWLAEHQPAGRGHLPDPQRLPLRQPGPGPDDPLRVVGVLDWEMATVGDPLMDLGGALAYWVEAGDDEFFAELPAPADQRARDVDPGGDRGALLRRGWALD